MRVNIDGKWYDSFDCKIILELYPNDKRLIENMSGESNHILFYPDKGFSSDDAARYYLRHYADLPQDEGNSL